MPSMPGASASAATSMEVDEARDRARLPRVCGRLSHSLREQVMRQRSRAGKIARERVLAALLLIVAAPVFVIVSVAMTLEGLFDRNARGPLLFGEQRTSKGRPFKLLKFRTLTRAALNTLGDGPTHIKPLEERGELTRVGRVLKQWYLDELPQLINIVRGDMGLIGTRPWPIELYEEQIAKGDTLKRDMPAGLIGPVSTSKGQENPPGLDADRAYFEAYNTYPGWKLLLLDVRIVARALRVVGQHKGL